MSEKSPPLEDLKGKVKEMAGELSSDEALVEEGEVQQMAATLEKEQGLTPSRAQAKARARLRHQT